LESIIILRKNNDRQNTVAKLRAALGLTQHEFANTLGISYASVQNYEAGKAPSARIYNELIGLALDSKLAEIVMELEQDPYFLPASSGPSVPVPETASESKKPTDPAAEKIQWPGINETELEFLAECLRIYRSQFGKPLQENVTFFGIGLNAVEAIARMKVRDEQSAGDAKSTGARERRASALLDHAQDEAHLLKKATLDVVEELRRDRTINPRTSGGIEPRRKSGARKTGGGS
jgi:transcriptional regulator with XRE-family HTH domain